MAYSTNRTAQLAEAGRAGYAALKRSLQQKGTPTAQHNVDVQTKAPAKKSASAKSAAKKSAKPAKKAAAKKTTAKKS